jgi:signal transduction histidine kinase
MEEATSEIIYSIITFSLFVLMLAIALILLFMNYLKNKRRLLKENEIMKATFAHTLLQSQLEIQEQVFTQISQEIHDNIGQALSLARLNINTIGPLANEDKIRQTDQLLGKAIQDLRNLGHLLNTNFIKDIGFIEAVRQLVGSLQRTGQFETTFTTTLSFTDMNDEKAILLFRMIQETINNIIRHANATHIQVDISGEEELEQVRIEDNGQGFNLEQALQKKAGIGINNMMQRAQFAGVQVAIHSALTQGTIVTITNNPSSI